MALVKEETDTNWSELFEINMSEETIAQDCLACLQKKFGHSSFREMQWKIVASILNDRRDNCVIMATGYGKSLCYQFPSIYLDTVTIVVSPLISLMQDQVLGLRLNNLRACFLGSAQENRDTLFEIIDRRYNIVYVTPEYITSDKGGFLLNKVQEYLTLIAIDEAHCISKWGHDFRSAYRNLSRLRDMCPTVPILAMTATATPHVRDDIIQSLKLCNAQVISTGFDRPNLEFSVNYKSNVWADIGPHIAGVKIGSVIVYCISRRVTAEVAATITSKGHPCGVYHAGLSLAQRKKTHEDFIHDRIRVICATIAFGMGINKPDVRLVIHYGVAKDVESYYQEVGRAGRDGLPSKCIMFYENRDWTTLSMLRNKTNKSGPAFDHQEKLEQVMRRYVSSNACRRCFILTYFGESCANWKPRPNCCDNCKRQNYKQNLFQRFEGLCEDGLLDITNESLKLLTIVQDSKGSFGLQKSILILRGSKSKNVPEQWLRHPLYGSLSDKTVKWLDAVGNTLRNTGMMTTVAPMSKWHRSHPACVISSKGQELLRTGGPLRIPPSDEFLRNLKIKVKSLPKILRAKPPDNQLPTSNAVQTASSTTVPVKSDAPAVFDIYRPLLKVRTKLASLFDVMPYLVASTKALQQLAKLQPASMDELRKLELDGYSEEKIQRFGPVFLKVIRDFQAKIAKSMKKDAPVMGNSITRHLILPDCSDQPSTSANASILGPVKEEKYMPQFAELPNPHSAAIERPKPDATAIEIDFNQRLRGEENSVQPNSQDSVKVIESTPPPVIDISDSEEESKDHESWQSEIGASALLEHPKADTPAMEIGINRTLREEEKPVQPNSQDSVKVIESTPPPMIEISDSEEEPEEHESWQSGIRDSEFLEVGYELDEKSNQDSISDIENDELDSLLAALQTERVYSCLLNRRAGNGDAVRNKLPDNAFDQSDLETLVLNDTSAGSDVVSLSLESNATEVNADADISEELWDPDVDDADLTQISEKAEQEIQEAPATIPLCPADPAPPKCEVKKEQSELDFFLDEVNLYLNPNNLSKGSQNEATQKTTVTARAIKKSPNAFEYEEEQTDVHLNDLDLIRISQHAEQQIRETPATIPSRPVDRNSSVNSAKCKVKIEMAEQTELDLFLDVIQQDLNRNIPQNGGTHRTAMKARVIKKASNAFEYEDDPASESDGERGPVTTPRKRVLPKWMQPANKKMR